MVLGVERLASHLLGREHRQVGDLLADAVKRAPGLELDVAARRGDELLALVAAGRRSIRLGGLGGLAGSDHDVVRLLSGLLEALAVLAEQLVRLGTLRLGRVDAVPDGVGALLERLTDPRQRDPREDEQRQPEREQRPDHQPERGRDQEVAA